MTPTIFCLIGRSLQPYVPDCNRKLMYRNLFICLHFFFCNHNRHSDIKVTRSPKSNQIIIIFIEISKLPLRRFKRHEGVEPASLWLPDHLSFVDLYAMSRAISVLHPKLTFTKKSLSGLGGTQPLSPPPKPSLVGGQNQWTKNGLLLTIIGQDIIRNNQGWGKSSASADNTYWDLFLLTEVVLF